MERKTAMLNVAFGAIFGFIGFWLIFFLTNPQHGSFWMIFLFYLNLFLWLAGSLSFLGYFFRNFKKTNKNKDELFVSSLRQSVLLSTLLVVILLLQSQKLFNWWIGTTVFLIVFLTEVYFSRNNKC